MVFGWGKKKTTNESIGSIRQERQITFSDVNSILKETELQILHRILEQAKSVCEELEIERKQIQEITLQLDEDNLNVDDVDKNIKTIVERGKKSIVSNLKKETANTLSVPKTYSELLTLNSQTGLMLKRIGDTLGLNSRVMHVFARKYADKLKIELGSMSENKKLLQVFVDEHTNFEFESKNIIENIETIKDLTDETANKKNRLAEILAKIDEDNQTTQELEKKMYELKSTKEYQEFTEIKKEIEKLGPERNKIKSQVDLQFSKISRPLGKYSYISSLEKPLKNIMNNLIDDPLTTITDDNKNAIIEILQAVVKSTVAGNISVKDSQKTVEQIEETINKLDEFLKLKNTMNKQVNDLEGNLIIFNIKDLEEKEKRNHIIKEEIAQLKSSISILEGEISSQSKRISEIIAYVEEKLGKLSKAKISLKN